MDDPIVVAFADTHVEAHDRNPPWLRATRDLSPDLVLVAGDLTEHGLVTEFRTFSDMLRSVTDAPALAVLGNHDIQACDVDMAASVLSESNIEVLAGATCHVDLNGARIGVAGTKGYWGGWPHSPVGYEEPSMRPCAEELRSECTILQAALERVERDAFSIAMLHYLPSAGGLQGEPPEVHNFLGADALGQTLAGCRVDLVVHGHAHSGAPISYIGATPVVNVAMPARRGRPLAVRLPKEGRS